MSSETHTPASASLTLTGRLLGFGGLLPFVAALVLIGATRYPGPGLLLIAAYGAVILSFVGAVHWGIALTAEQPEPARMAVSVLPALAGCAALLLPSDRGLQVLLVAFVGFGIVERLFFSARLPPWFRALRLQLTTGVCLCLLGALILL